MKQRKQPGETDRRHKRTIPRPSAGEVGLSITKIAAAATPMLIAPQTPELAIAGAAVGELLSLIVGPILSKRQRDVVQELEDGIHALQRDHPELTDATLQQNESLVSAISAAVPAMLRTQLHTKRVALRNVVLHAALPDTPEESLLRTFIDDVDALTPWHLDLLTCIADPLAWAAQHDHPVYQPQAGINVVQMFEAVYRERLPVQGYERIIVTDLYNHGLAATGVDPYGPAYPMSQGSTVPHLTELGKQFLAYITSPLKKKDEDNAIC